jgi:hypothetical protein
MPAGTSGPDGDPVMKCLDRKCADILNGSTA